MVRKEESEDAVLGRVDFARWLRGDLGRAAAYGRGELNTGPGIWPPATDVPLEAPAAPAPVGNRMPRCRTRVRAELARRLGEALTE